MYEKLNVRRMIICRSLSCCLFALIHVWYILTSCTYAVWFSFWHLCVMFYCSEQICIHRFFVKWSSYYLDFSLLFTHIHHVLSVYHRIISKHTSLDSHFSYRYCAWKSYYRKIELSWNNLWAFNILAQAVLFPVSFTVSFPSQVHPPHQQFSSHTHSHSHSQPEWLASFERPPSARQNALGLQGEALNSPLAWPSTRSLQSSSASLPQPTRVVSVSPTLFRRSPHHCAWGVHLFNPKCARPPNASR